MRHFVSFAVLFGMLAAAPAFAANLGANNAELEHLREKKLAGGAFAEEDWALWNKYTADAAQYNQLGEKIRPVCSDGGMDVAPDCSTLTPEQIKGTHAQLVHGGITFRYRYPLKVIAEMERKRTALEKKWSGE